MMGNIISEIELNKGLQSKLAIITYRIGFIQVFITRSKVIKFLLGIPYFILKGICKLLHCGDIPSRGVFIDWGLVLPNSFHGILISQRTTIGRNCTIYHNVKICTAGNILKRPFIGDNVFIGEGCMLIGDVKVGNDCVISAGTKLVDVVVTNNTALAK
jgi:serine acetyltransferase